MFLHIQNVLTPEEIAFFRQSLGADAPWVDGARSAGGQALHQKNNLQLSQASELSAQLQAKVKAAVHRSALFFSAALPRRIFNPLFNNYGDGTNHYGNHVDSAVMHSKADGCWVRSDLSCTLFLTPPEDYDGGELVLEGTDGETPVKLAAGSLVLYATGYKWSCKYAADYFEWKGGRPQLYLSIFRRQQSGTLPPSMKRSASCCSRSCARAGAGWRAR